MWNDLSKKSLVVGIVLCIVFSGVSTVNLIGADSKSNFAIVDGVTGFLTSSYNLSKYWGNKDMKLTNGTGFFDTYKDENGVWWFVDPEGYAFYSAGVDVVYAGADEDYNATILKKYGSYSAWANSTKQRLKDWNYNTLGAWSDYEFFPEMPYTYKFKSGRKLGRIGWEIYVLKNGSGKLVPDVFDSYWWDIVKDNISEHIEKYKSKEDPWLIGYWLDNEISWESDPYPFDQNTLLETYLSVPYEFNQPGKMKVVEFLIDRYKDDGIEVFNKVWNMNLKSFDELYNITKLGRTGWKAQHFIPRIKDDIQDFTQLVAHTYFKNITNIVRSYDPNHLILGVRFHLLGAPEEVINESGKYCDVVSINYYRDRLVTYDPIKYLTNILRGTVPLDKWMQRYYKLTDKPLIVGEFCCAAMPFPLLLDLLSGGKTVRTQKDRAGYFEWYARNCLGAPYVIGYHWFGYFYYKGLVDINDNPYSVLVDRMAYINNMIYKLHKSCIN